MTSSDLNADAVDPNDIRGNPYGLCRYLGIQIMYLVYSPGHLSVS